MHSIIARGRLAGLMTRVRTLATLGAAVLALSACVLTRAPLT